MSKKLKRKTTINQILGKKPMNPSGKEPIRILAWGATPFVITGFGVVMKEILKNLYRSYPGSYDICQVAINYHGDFCEEMEITGGLQNGRLRQWPAACPMPGGAGMNLYGQPKFLQLIKGHRDDFDVVFLFEDPFWLGGTIPGSNMFLMDAVRSELVAKGMGHVPIVSYFPIDGIPKQSWIENIAKADFPITYLNFGANLCTKLCPSIAQKLSIIPHGVNQKEFFPIPKEEARSFKRAMLGDKFADKFMVLNVNRNQLRKLIPSNMIAFKQFKQLVPDAVLYLNMQAVDVGWNLLETCQSLQLRPGVDVFFPPDFNVQKGLTVEELNKLFNCADVVSSTAVGGGWELSISQAFATRTSVLAPANTSHVELCGNQVDENERRGLLYHSGRNLAQTIVFPGDNEVLRPLPDTDDMVSKLKHMYENPEMCRKMEDVAFNWVKNNLRWDTHIAPQFHNVFSAAKKLKNHRLLELQQQSAPQVTRPTATQPVPAAQPGSVSFEE